MNESLFPANPAPIVEPKPDKKPKGNRKAGGYVPLLIDFTLTTSRLIVLSVGLGIAAFSLISQATILAAAIRGGAAALSVGLVMWVINWLLARQALDAAIEELEQKQKEEEELPPESTMELQA